MVVEIEFRKRRFIQYEYPIYNVISRIVFVTLYFEVLTMIKYINIFFYTFVLLHCLFE